MIAMIFDAAEWTKRGLKKVKTRFSLSGVTPGQREEPNIRRESDAA